MTEAGPYSAWSDTLTALKWSATPVSGYEIHTPHTAALDPRPEDGPIQCRFLQNKNHINYLI